VKTFTFRKRDVKLFIAFECCARMGKVLTADDTQLSKCQPVKFSLKGFIWKLATEGDEKKTHSCIFAHVPKILASQNEINS
jgi:hypothetical protein